MVSVGLYFVSVKDDRDYVMLGVCLSAGWFVLPRLPKKLQTNFAEIITEG